eukprot:gene11079-biopygen4415
MILTSSSCMQCSPTYYRMGWHRVQLRSPVTVGVPLQHCVEGDAGLHRAAAGPGPGPRTGAFTNVNALTTGNVKA